METRRLGLQDLREDELARTVGRLLTLRVLLLPVAFGLVMLIVLLDPAPWRRQVALAFLPLALLFAVLERRRYRRFGMQRRTMVVNVSAQIGILSVIVIMTGGVRSAFTVPLTVLVLVQAVLLPSGVAWRVCAAVCTFLAALGGLQAFGPAAVVQGLNFGGEARDVGAAMTLLRTAFLLTFVGAAQVAARVIRRSFEAMASRALSARDDALQSYADESKMLTTLAGEIAHELKNPLASLKGLAGLLAKSAEGPAGECVKVMRREIERMQSILEEFLNFSRPLVPLTQGEVDLCALCSDTALLHEGLAAEKGVRVRVENTFELVIRCDRRKVKQILVNLLQNAIAASPEGGEIVVRLDSPRVEGVALARIVVEDSGKGLSPEIAQRLFTPGTTTKSGGSGLGLTVSRALARQHGGELTLRNLEVGCAAELTLPCDQEHPTRLGSAHERAGSIS
jgi:signal transduction histidine kinase